MSDSPSHPSTAAHFIDGLVDCGIEHLFCNLGTDHVSLIEAMAEHARRGRPQPRVWLCPHENVAIHMAAGYAAVTGRGQGVLVHVDAGTANAAMGLHNLFRSRWPVLLMAGRAPFTLRGELPGSRDNYIHFVQDLFDIGSLVRPYVKWEYALPSGVVTKEVLRRAHSVMHSDPQAPVFLTLPRETLAETWPAERVAAFAEARYGAVRAGGIAHEDARRIAERLLRANNPVVITSYLGRRPEAVAALEALALAAGVRVHEFMPTAMNLSRESPCFGGFDPARAIAGADVGLLLDIDVPWLPQFVQPDAATSWIHLDVDPLKQDFPVWGFATDMRLQADCATALAQVLDAVHALVDDAQRARIAQRVAAWEAELPARRTARDAAARAPGAAGAISPAHLCAALNAAIARDDIVINEAIRNSAPVLQQIVRTQPGTLIGCAGGGLGFSGGLALGAKLARPGARVLQIVGDGSFHFSAPTAVYAVAQQYALPIFTVVLDNGGWQAVKDAVLRVHPSGDAARADEFHARLRGEQRRFEQVAQAFGAHGEAVRDAAELPAAIARCLAAVDRGQAAVLNVAVSPL